MAHRLTRQELHDLVWAEPMQKLAPKFGLSDVAVAKACRRAEIPVPERGYWAAAWRLPLEMARGSAGCLGVGVSLNDSRDSRAGLGGCEPGMPRRRRCQLLQGNDRARTRAAARVLGYSRSVLPRTFGALED